MSSVEPHENNNITEIYLSFLKKTFNDIDEVLRNNYESIAIAKSFNVTQDQREDSNISLVVAPNTDDKAILCQTDADIIIKRDLNDNSYQVPGLPSQEIKNNYISDDEPSSKKSKQFTFTESDLPDCEEIKEFLKSYPTPIVTEPDSDSMQSDSESTKNSENDNIWFSRRRRTKTKPVTEVTIDKLPTRFITRQRVPNIYLVCKKNCFRVLLSSYLKTHEKQMDEDIIHENINRLKIHNKGKVNVKIVKSERKDTKSKSFAPKSAKKRNLDSIMAAKSTIRRTRYLKNKTSGGKNTKRPKPHNTGKTNNKQLIVRIEKLKRKDTKSTLAATKNNKKCTSDCTSEARTNTGRTRSMKNKADGKNTKGMSGSAGNIKNNDERRRTHKKERSALHALVVRRSKRYQKLKVEDKPKAPVSITKKSMHEHSTVYNIPSSSSESPKRWKRSLIEDSEAPTPKRTRSQSIKVTKASTPVGIIRKTRHRDEREKRISGLKKQDSNTKILKRKTRSHTALRKTRGTPRTSTKRL